jgi:hypothetical protein
MWKLKMTKTERQAIKKQARLRVGIAFASAQKLTGDPALWKNLARLMLTLSTRELSRLRK